jgi:2,4-dienoyl-CoA reductase-like NADH-dependent reductase (Old Yellow Enzyme family)
VLPNRIMKAAMSEALADDRHSPDERLVRLYDRWSRGGYGLLIIGNVMVDRAQLASRPLTRTVISRIRRPLVPWPAPRPRRARGG